MKVNAQLLRVITEEVESIDYGKVTITVNESGKYVEIATEKRQRVVKTEDVDDMDYHRG